MRPLFAALILCAACSAPPRGDGDGAGEEPDAGPTIDLPALSIADASRLEGANGLWGLSFELHLSRAAESDVTVSWATADGTATLSGGDYVAGSGVITIPAGATTASHIVLVQADKVDEPDESFELRLSNPNGAALSDGVAVGTILDDDDPPAFSISGASGPEGNTGSPSLRFAVSLSSPSGKVTTVDYATVAGTAAVGSDFTAATGTLTFQPGEIARQLDIGIVADTVNEPDESFTVTLSNPVNATIDAGSANGAINNDDVPAPVFVSIADRQSNEGASGTVTFVFTVSLNPAPTTTTRVDYATADDTATSTGTPGAGGSDYVATSGTLLFAVGETSKQISVTVNGDNVYEADEKFFVNLSNAVGLTMSDGQAVGTITNDEAKPSITMLAAQVPEGIGGTRNLIFPIELSRPAQTPVSFFYGPISGGTATKTSPFPKFGQSDYSTSSATVTISPGATTAEGVVVINGDQIYEEDETVRIGIDLFGVSSNATVATPSVYVTIQNDDPPPSLRFLGFGTDEGDAGTHNAAVVVGLSAPSALPVLVDYLTADGTATDPSDYVGSFGTVFFDGGETGQAFAVPVVGDGIAEQNEQFNVTFFNPRNATLPAVASAAVSIFDDDSSLPRLNVGDVIVTEGTLSAYVTVSVSSLPPVGQPVTVSFATADDTATAGTDYQAVSRTLTFSSGDPLTQTVAISIANDNRYELNESFKVVLSSAQNAFLQRSVGAVTINNDDSAPTMTIAGTFLIEGTSNPQNASFQVSLIGPTDVPATVAFYTEDLSALSTGTLDAGTRDYEPVAAVMVIPPGGQTVNVQINDDAVHEGIEYFKAYLTAPVHAKFSGSSDPSADCSINDAD